MLPAIRLIATPFARVIWQCSLILKLCISLTKGACSSAAHEPFLRLLSARLPHTHTDTGVDLATGLRKYDAHRGLGNVCAWRLVSGIT